MKRIWSAEKISLADKEELLAELNKLDKGDWFDETKFFCKSAHPENKEMMWDIFFDDRSKEWGLNQYI